MTKEDKITMEVRSPLFGYNDEDKVGGELADKVLSEVTAGFGKQSGFLSYYDWSPVEVACRILDNHVGERFQVGFLDVTGGRVTKYSAEETILPVYIIGKVAEGLSQLKTS